MIRQKSLVATLRTFAFVRPLARHASHAAMRRLVTATTTIAIFLVLGSVAEADITVCNDIRAPIHVAFANQAEDGFSASGWWNVEPNDCKPVDFPFEGAVLYYSADSDEYRDGRATSRDHWGNKVRLFVTRTRFDFDNAERSRRGTRAEMFSSYEVPPSYLGKPAAITLHFTHGSTTINVKAGK
jgi:uncharacterized membrane protein